MTRHDILNLAVDADPVDVLDIVNNPRNLSDDYISAIERFAELVAAHERKTICQMAEDICQVAAKNCNDDPPTAVYQAYMRGQFEMATYIAKRFAQGTGHDTR